mmetsp:Transcript_15813/g.40129  ORF Transcript_15813/g.40129 Transcript_15813/m.40129 type:complete len:559 (-) Transcript_15813:592-2268(-)
MAAEPAPAPSGAERLQEQHFEAALKLLQPKLRKRVAGKRTFARAVQRRAEPLQWQIKPPEAAATAEQQPSADDPWHRFSPEAKAALEAGAKARAAWKPPSKPTGFAKAEDRDKAWVQRAADALIPMLPTAVAEAMAGRDDGQLSSHDRAWQARAAVVRQAGRSGNRAEVLIEVSKLLVFMEAFARTLGVQLFPMQPAMVAMIVGGEHARATAAGVGSRGGATTGARIRSTIQMMADSFEFPIDYDAPCVWGAAPAAKAGGEGGRQSVAAAAPLKMSLHTMRLARSPHPSPGRYVARSMVFAEITGARVQDCERLVLARDARQNVMSAKAYTAKDGEPLELFAYARDFFGVIPWWEEHITDAERLGGIAFPLWDGPWGCKRDIFKATSLREEAADCPAIRKAYFAVWAQAPLSCGDAERKEAALRGHTLHGSVADAAGFIGLNPVVPYPLESDLKSGFQTEDERILGNWRRDKKGESGGPPRLGNGIAQPPGAADARAESQHVYGRGQGRKSSREQQLRARGRLCRFIEAAVKAWGTDRPLSELPEGSEDWRIVIPHGE